MTEEEIKREADAFSLGTTILCRDPKMRAEVNRVKSEIYVAVRTALEEFQTIPKWWQFIKRRRMINKIKIAVGKVMTCPAEEVDLDR